MPIRCRATDSCIKKELPLKYQSPLLVGCLVADWRLAPDNYLSTRALLLPHKKDAKMKQELLIDQVDSWIRMAATVASYARGTQNAPIITPDEMSSFLQIRWFLSNNRIKVQLEHNKKAGNDYWLSSFSIGGIDPYLLVFRRNETLTDTEMDTVESIVVGTFPNIELIRCHFCKSRIVNDYQENEWFCASCLDLISTKRSSAFGYVYVFGSTDEGRYKIGQGKNPDARLKDYELSKLPFPVEMIHVIPVDNKHQAEADLHKLFANKRENGEWFRLSPKELDRITQLRGYRSGEWV